MLDKVKALLFECACYIAIMAPVAVLAWYQLEGKYL